VAVVSDLWWFLIGLAVLPTGAGLFLLGDWLIVNTRKWYTKPRDLTDSSLRFRRSMITGVALELLDATHARVIRLPFSRVLVIRSNSKSNYVESFVRRQSTVVGGDYQNAFEVLGKALDELGYEVVEEVEGV
jgi:hypothetical protein